LRETSTTYWGEPSSYDLSSALIENCLFAANTIAAAAVKEQAPYPASTARFVNSTFSGNAVGLSLPFAGGSAVSAVGCVLWGNTNVQVNEEHTYDPDAPYYLRCSRSCIQGGYPGPGNISSDPNFRNPDNPAGPDGRYGTSDDGLRLQYASPCMNTADAAAAPEDDIRGVERKDGGLPDMGAYENEIPTPNPNIFGRLVDGQFLPMPIVVYDQVEHAKYVRLLGQSNDARVVQLVLPKDKYTKRISSFYTDVVGLRPDGQQLPSAVPVRITLYKVAEQSRSLVFRTVLGGTGKPILFVADPKYQGWENPWAYVVYVHKDGSILSVTPTSQF
jgi:hypothetical protein